MKKTQGRTQGRTKSAGAHPGALIMSEFALCGVFVSSSTRINDIQGHVRLSFAMNLVVPASGVAAQFLVLGIFPNIMNFHQNSVLLFF